MWKKDIFAVFLFIFILMSFQTDNFSQEIAQKAVMIIASQDFRDEELLLPKERLEVNKIKVVIAGASLSPTRGMLGTVVKPDILIEDIKIEEYDAVIFVGGSGAKQFWDDTIVHNLALKAQALGKVIGAICIAPVTLARAGILKGKKATVWPGVAQEFKTCGVNYTGKDVEIDGNIITANGPEAAGEFGETLVRLLVQRR